MSSNANVFKSKNVYLNSCDNHHKVQMTVVEHAIKRGHNYINRKNIEVCLFAKYIIKL